MKKRSAMSIAGGLVAALVAGFAAMSLGFARGDTTPTASAERVEPRVRTIERTVTIHKKAKSEEAPVVRTIPAPAPASASAPASADDEDGYEDDGFEDHDDDGYEDDGFEDHDDDDGYEDEDHDEDGEDGDDGSDDD
ncbi:MAG: hypothetical protein ACXWXP_09405 [Actinomycetota bacterium]